MSNERVVVIKLKIKVYEDEIAPMSVPVWIYHLVSRLNYEHDIMEVEVDGVNKKMKNDNDVKNLSLRENKELE